MMKCSLKPFKSISQVVLMARSFSEEASFQTGPFKLHRLDSGPSENVVLKREEALQYFSQMSTIRRIETAAGNLFKEKRVRGFCHLYAGQEACAVGMKASMQPGDSCITSYRCHGWTYLMSGDVKNILCELTGRITGNVHGKGGSMHMYGEDYYGGNGIVGAQIPVGTGLAFAMNYRKKKNVSLTIYGDGAANQGQFFESVNMAKLWNLPVIYICENNGYGMGTSAERSSASIDFYSRGDFVPGIWVDGMDILTVRESMQWARDYCVAGNGPLVIEMATYRYSGHSMSDPGTSYRSRDEVQGVRKAKDPITNFKDKIITSGLTSDEEIKEIEAVVRDEVDGALASAHTDPIPHPQLLYTDIYHNTTPQMVRGKTFDDTHVQAYTTTAEFLNSPQNK